MLTPHQPGTIRGLNVDPSILSKPIDALRLSTRASQCLKSQRIHSIGALVELRAFDLMKISNFGRVSLDEVKAALAGFGLKLRGQPEGLSLRFRRLHPEARLPVRATDGAACFDLHAFSDCGGMAGLPQPLPVEFVGACTFGTGLAVEVPPGHALMIYSRSGHGFNHDVRLANAVGVIDSDYRGEVKVRLTCDGDKPFKVNRGDRIAQAMLIPVPDVELIEVDALTETARGAGGLGSTGA